MTKKYLLWTGSVLLFGLALRLLAAAYGYNHDFESYRIVAGIISDGGNVYAETSRYNYGPVWFMVLNFLNGITRIFAGGVNWEVFRLILALFLSYVDICISLLLGLRYGRRAGLLYWLNPVSIIITGYFSQFDNLAVLLGLLAMLLLGKNKPRSTLAGLGLLGISLMTKHILLFYPLWLMFRMKTGKQKLQALLIPYGIFILGFLPFIFTGSAGIWENVFRYHSVNNLLLIRAFFPQVTGAMSYYVGLWLLVMVLVIGAVIFKKRKLFENFLMYLLLLIVFAPSVLPYYFAIVLPVLAVYPNILSFVFSGLTAYIMMLDGLGMNISRLVNSSPEVFLYQFKGNLNIMLSVLVLALYFIIIGSIRTDKRKPS